MTTSRPYRLVQRVTGDVPRTGSALEYLRRVESSVWDVSPEPISRPPEVQEALRTSPRTVGIWDISARLPYLYDLVEALNVRKDRLLFFEIVASVPLGVEANAKRIEELVKTFGEEIAPEDRDGLRRNIVANDILPRVRQLRGRFGLDYVSGVVRQPILFHIAGKVHWDYFSTAEGREALVSLDEVREFAARAGRSVDAAVGFLVLGIVACLVVDGLGYHDESRGCLFDCNESRVSLVESLRAFRLCPSCRRIVAEASLDDVLEQILGVLKEFRPPRS